MKTVLWTVALSVALTGAARAEKPLPPPRPVPVMQVVPLPDHEISFQRDGAELARYHFAPTLRRPFIFPVIGPAGRSLTRMGHPHDPEGHSHHNSIWISHHDVNGVSFWDDRGKGRILHQRVERLDDGAGAASALTASAWTTEAGKVLLRERRQTSALPLPRDEWLLLIDLRLEAGDEPATFGKTPFGIIGVRMARSIGVNDGGGTIRNSAGGVNEKEVFWKPARWVDYSGPITARATEGITLMDHPANPNHPAVFHVRNDGWMGALLTFDGPRVVTPGQPLVLRYGIYVHAGRPAEKSLQQSWEHFTTLPLPDWKTKP